MNENSLEYFKLEVMWSCLRSKKTTPTILGRTLWKGQGWDGEGDWDSRALTTVAWREEARAGARSSWIQTRAAVKKWMHLRDLDGEKNEICWRGGYCSLPSLRQGKRRPILREKLMDFRLVVFYGPWGGARWHVKIYRDLKRWALC